MHGLCFWSGARGGCLTRPPARGEDSGETSEQTEAADCEDAAEALPLKRLSAAQYRHTLDDLVERLGGIDNEDWAWWYGYLMDEVWAPYLPDDIPTPASGQVRGGYRRMDQAVYQQHVEGQLIIAQGLAVDLALAAGWRINSQLEGVCDLSHELWSDAARGPCVETWVRDLGMQTHRRPLTEEQALFYLSVFDSAVDASSEDVFAYAAEDGFRDVFITMLTSPWFVYHVELADEGTGELDAYSLASRLSYHIWQSSPDAELYEAAASGRLLTDEGYRAEVERMIADEKAHRALEEFYEDWLQVEKIPAMNTRVGTIEFDAFSNGFEPSSDLHEAMAAELVKLGVHHTLEQPGPLDELLLSDRMVSDHEQLAELYGAPTWDGRGEPPALTDRSGLLTRAGLVASGSANTRPIIKGVFIRESVLCDHLSPPPDNANTAPLELSEHQTTREVVEALTEVQGTDCAGCHMTLINPLGYATEGFDALGRVRTHQPLFDALGDEVAAPPVDTSGTTLIAGGLLDFADITDLTSEIVGSGAAHQCFAREFFRFTTSREESAGQDDCTIQTWGEALSAGVPLDQFLVDVALDPQFKQLAPPAQ